MAGRPEAPKTNMRALRFFLEATKAIVVNGVKDNDEDLEKEDVELQSEEATNFRAVCARMNSAAQDCPDIQYAVKEMCRSMAKPTAQNAEKLKRLARHWLSWTETWIKFPWHGRGQSFGRVRRRRLGRV